MNIPSHPIKGFPDCRRQSGKLQ